nr:type II toxin-antitoxin system VapC family toxin [Candidatus Njordarchaeota archaeon]
MVCLDTDILVFLLKGDPKALAFIKKLEASGQQLKTSAISAYELTKGAAISSRSKENLRLVGDMLSSIKVLSLNQRSSEAAASIYRDLMNTGKIVGELDILIGGICAYSNKPLVSNDRHFQELGKYFDLIRW